MHVETTAGLRSSVCALTSLTGTLTKTYNKGVYRVHNQCVLLNIVCAYNLFHTQSRFHGSHYPPSWPGAWSHILPQPYTDQAPLEVQMAIHVESHATIWLSSCRWAEVRRDSVATPASTCFMAVICEAGDKEARVEGRVTDEQLIF